MRKNIMEEEDQKDNDPLAESILNAHNVEKTKKIL